METVFFQFAVPATHLIARGSDAFTFVQGQFSNDLRGPVGARAVYGLWLNQKGKTLSDSHVLVRAEDAVEVCSLKSPVGVIRERLEAYIIADDVELEDCTEGARIVTVAGTGAGAALSALGIAPPDAGSFAVWKGTRVIRGRAAGRLPSWHVLISKGADSDCFGLLEAAAKRPGARVVEDARLDEMRIVDGVPEVPTELGSADLPMEGGLEREAISFTKGCYLGQEVMARLHNMGQVRRRLYVVKLPTVGSRPAVGSPLLVEGKKVGDLRSRITTTSGIIGMAMLQTHAMDRVGRANLEDGTVVEIVRRAEGVAW